MEKISLETRRLVLIDKIAPRAGWVCQGGTWVKFWPSGKSWVIDACGEWGVICDEHGRIIRGTDPKHGKWQVSVIGLLAESLRK
jgi:hypothetical protein